MRFSHRLAPTRDQSQSGSVIRPKQSRAHQPQLTCMLTKGLSGDPAVFLFGWLAWGRPSPSRSSPVVCFSGKQGTGAMPTGLFITSDQSVQVDYEGVSIPIPRSTYENNGYKPDFDNLPLEAEYMAAKEKLGNVPKP